jgi:hypothetical protein
MWDSFLEVVSMADGNEDVSTSTGSASKSVTILLPAELVEEVDELADKELRSRSKQIEKMLKEAMKVNKAPSRR